MQVLLRKLSCFILSAQLSNNTTLRAVVSSSTRWNSTLQMLRHYTVLEQHFQKFFDGNLEAFLLNEDEKNDVDAILRRLGEFDYDTV